METMTKESIQELLTLALPKEIVEDLDRIATFNDTTVEDLVYSYIVEGVVNDSLTVKRMEFTDKANEALEKNNLPHKKIQDIFDNLVY